MRLEGKVALISGAARGMGAEEARIFAREGAKVVIGDISQEEGKAVEAQISEAGGQALFVTLDVTQEDAWANAVDQAVSRFGKLDVLVNNAGISSRAFTDDTGIDAWDKIMEVTQAAGGATRYWISTRDWPRSPAWGRSSEWTGPGGRGGSSRTGRGASRP